MISGEGEDPMSNEDVSPNKKAKSTSWSQTFRERFWGPTSLLGKVKHALSISKQPKVVQDPFDLKKATANCVKLDDKERYQLILNQQVYSQQPSITSASFNPKPFPSPSVSFVSSSSVSYSTRVRPKSSLVNHGRSLFKKKACLVPTNAPKIVGVEGFVRGIDLDSRYSPYTAPSNSRLKQLAEEKKKSLNVSHLNSVATSTPSRLFPLLGDLKKKVENERDYSHLLNNSIDLSVGIVTPAQSPDITQRSPVSTDNESDQCTSRSINRSVLDRPIPAAPQESRPRRISDHDLSGVETKIPEIAKHLKEEIDKLKNVKQPEVWGQLRKLDENNHSKEMEEIESRLLHVTIERKKVSDDIKKSQSALSPRLGPSFYPEFIPPVRVFKEPEEEQEEIEEEVILLPPIEEIEEYIDERYSASEDDNEVLIEMFDIPIRKKDLETLHGLNWLNDEVINFYFQMVMKRSTEAGRDNLPKIYVFNTFFYSSLTTGPAHGYNKVRRWTRKVDIFSFDYILIPLHLGMHWTLASINCKKRRISYYDSMGGGMLNGKGSVHQKNLLFYLQNEHKDKKGADLPSDWVFNDEGVDDDDRTNQIIPQQENGSDCGVFTCRFAEYISRRMPFNFSQEHMPYFRRRMIYEILHGKLVD